MKITNIQTNIYNNRAHKKNPPSFQGLRLELNSLFDTKSKIKILEAFDKNSYLMDFFKKNDVFISISDEMRNHEGIYFLDVFMDIYFKKFPKKEVVLTKPSAIQRLFGAKPIEQTVIINDSWKNINTSQYALQEKYTNDFRIKTLEKLISSFDKEHTIEQEYQRQLAKRQKDITENLKDNQRLNELRDKILG